MLSQADGLEEIISCQMREWSLHQVQSSQLTILQVATELGESTVAQLVIRQVQFLKRGAPFQCLPQGFPTLVSQLILAKVQRQ